MMGLVVLSYRSHRQNDMEWVESNSPLSAYNQSIFGVSKDVATREPMMIVLVVTYAAMLASELQQLSEEGYHYYIADPLNPLELCASSLAAIGIAWLSTPLLSLAFGIICFSQLMRLFLLSSSLGPLVQILYRIISDVALWMQLLLAMNATVTITMLLELYDTHVLYKCDDYESRLLSCPQCALQIKTKHNCASGATAVHIRRSKRTAMRMSETVTRRNVRACVAIPTDINDDTGRKRQHHADTQLAYSAGTLAPPGPTATGAGRSSEC